MPFDALLSANCCETAIRIARAATGLGVRTVGRRRQFAPARRRSADETHALGRPVQRRIWTRKPSGRRLFRQSQAEPVEQQAVVDRGCSVPVGGCASCPVDMVPPVAWLVTMFSPVCPT